MSKLAGTAGSLLAVVGMLVFFMGVFGFGPKTFVFIGVGVIIAALIAYYLQERGERRAAGI